MNTSLLSRLDNAVTPADSCPPPADTFKEFAGHELTNLISAAITALHARGLPTLLQFTSPPPGYLPSAPPLPMRALPSPPVLPHTMHPMKARPTDMWDNAKVEQIICSGLRPPYDGSPENLIPTMNLINIRRRNEVWYPATFITQENQSIDLVMTFSQVKESTVLAHAQRLWLAPNATLQSHTRGTETYNNRLLGVFLMNSLTPEFAALLHARIDPRLLLHVLCQHIHRNHLAFVESIKHKIRQARLQDYGGDIPRYIRFLTENLRLISSTGATENEHNDLIPHLLLQLRGTTIPIFQQTVLKWQRDYFEGQMTLTPTTLVTKADQECQILKHAGQWVETIDPSVVAMQAMLQKTKQTSGDLLQSLAANFSAIAQKQRDRSSRHGTRSASQDTPDWLLKPPSIMGQIKHFNGRDWHYCTKCGRHGRWVCTHTDDTHNDSRRYNTNSDYRRSPSPNAYTNRQASSHTNRDGYYDRSRSPVYYDSRSSAHRQSNRSRSRSPYSGYQTDDSAPNDKHVSWNMNAPPTPVAKLSLLESINLFQENNE